VYVISLQNFIEIIKHLFFTKIIKHLNQQIGDCFYLINRYSNLGMKLR